MTEETDGTEMIWVQDHERTIMFEGKLLGEASSRRDGEPRWTEVRVFRRDSGGYVVEKQGRSELPGEVTRGWVHVSETAQGVVESLHRYDEDGVRFITRVARTALKAAAAQDESLQRAFSVETLK